MISRLIAFFILLLVCYFGLIFLAPDLADTYGSRDFNEKVRMFKRASELDRMTNASGSLMEKANDIAKPYVDESKTLLQNTKNTIDQANTVVSQKTEQAKQAVQSAQDTYNKVQETKSKFENLTNFGTGK